MLRLRLALSLALIFLSVGCSNEPEGLSYFGSLKDGERKTYDVKMLVPFTGQVNGVAIISNRGKETFDGETYYKTVATFEGIPGSQPETSYLRIGDDGIYSRKTLSADAPETLEFPLPATVGRTWVSKQDGLMLEMSITSIEDFDTASKTYKDCIKVVGTGTKDTHPIEATSYYAPDVGMVLMSMKGPEFTMEMKVRE